MDGAVEPPGMGLWRVSKAPPLSAGRATKSNNPKVSAIPLKPGSPCTRQLHLDGERRSLSDLAGQKMTSGGAGHHVDLDGNGARDKLAPGVGFHAHFHLSAIQRHFALYAQGIAGQGHGQGR